MVLTINISMRPSPACADGREQDKITFVDEPAPVYLVQKQRDGGSSGVGARVQVRLFRITSSFLRILAGTYEPVDLMQTLSNRLFCFSSVLQSSE